LNHNVIVLNKNDYITSITKLSVGLTRIPHCTVDIYCTSQLTTSPCKSCMSEVKQTEPQTAEIGTCANSTYYEPLNTNVPALSQLVMGAVLAQSHSHSLPESILMQVDSETA